MRSAVALVALVGWCAVAAVIVSGSAADASPSLTTSTSASARPGPFRTLHRSIFVRGSEGAVSNAEDCPRCREGREAPEGAEEYTLEGKVVTWCEEGEGESNYCLVHPVEVRLSLHQRVIKSFYSVDGRFSFSISLLPDSYELSAAWTSEGYARNSTWVDIPEDVDGSDIIIELYPFRIQGTVTSLFDDSLIEGAKVKLVKKIGHHQYKPVGDPFTTGADGTFLFDLASGYPLSSADKHVTYGIKVCAEGYEEWYSPSPIELADTCPVVTIDPKLKLDCQNGGTWNDQTHVCDCVGDYAGDRCEQLDCKNGATWNSGTGVCDCLAGFNGPLCQCANSPEPWDDVNDQCVCSGEWTGATCESSVCMFGTWTGTECDCFEGVAGAACDELACVFGTWDAENQECDCIPGFTGMWCEIGDGCYIDTDIMYAALSPRIQDVIDTNSLTAQPFSLSFPTGSLEDGISCPLTDVSGTSCLFTMVPIMLRYVRPGDILLMVASADSQLKLSKVLVMGHKIDSFINIQVVTVTFKKTDGSLGFIDLTANHMLHVRPEGDGSPGDAFSYTPDGPLDFLGYSGPLSNYHLQQASTIQPGQQVWLQDLPALAGPDCTSTPVSSDCISVASIPSARAGEVVSVEINTREAVMQEPIMMQMDGISWTLVVNGMLASQMVIDVVKVMDLFQDDATCQSHFTVDPFWATRAFSSSFTQAAQTNPLELDDAKEVIIAGFQAAAAAHQVWLAAQA